MELTLEEWVEKYGNIGGYLMLTEAEKRPPRQGMAEILASLVEAGYVTHEEVMSIFEVTGGEHWKK